jgi:hypothetical protein
MVACVSCVELVSANDGAPPRERPPAKVLRFTRHPKVLVASMDLPLQQGTRSTLEAMATAADALGLGWESPASLAKRIPRSGMVHAYSRYTMERGLTTLRDVEVIREDGTVERGLVTWVWIKPYGCFPKRIDSRTVAWGKGASAGNHGGRVWQLRLDVLEELRRGTARLVVRGGGERGTKHGGASTARVGTDLTGASTHAGPGASTHAAPSDPLVLPSEEQISDPARQERANARTLAALAERTPEVDVSSRPQEPAPRPPELGEPLRAAPPPERVASGTPPTLEGKRADAWTPSTAPPRETREATNEREQSSHHALPRSSHVTRVPRLDPNRTASALALLLTPKGTGWTRKSSSD